MGWEGGMCCVLCVDCAASIAENIRFGKESATDAEIEEAAKKADVCSFVSALPDGYVAKVGRS